jgi:signal peptidase II
MLTRFFFLTDFHMSRKIPREAWIGYLIALVVFILDHISKAYASQFLAHEELQSITSFFAFTLAHNYGAAFSFLANESGWQRWFFTGLAILVSAFLVVWILRTCITNKREAFALSLVLGGALGNLYDRVELGYVVDFIVLHYGNHSWPAFNVADSAITLGVILLIIEIFFQKEKSIHA